MRRSLHLVIVGVVLLLLTTFSGCMQRDASDVAREEAETIAVEGMRQLAAALADAEAGRLSSFEMTVAAPALRENGNDTTLTARLDWAHSGASRRHVVLQEGAERHETTIWCTSRYVYYEWDGAVYQERAIRDPSRGDPCRFDGIPQARNLLEPFTPEGAEALPAPEVYLSDGEVTAVFEFEGGERLVVRHDRYGLVNHVQGGGAAGTFDAYATYGPRGHFAPPEATERIPAHVETARVHDAAMDRSVHEVVVSWHAPVLREIEARWVARDPVDGVDVVLVSFPLQATKDEDARFGFDDVDGDGRLTPGDRYWFEEPVAEDAAGALHELVLFDLWAGQEVNAPVPGVVAPLLLLALIGLMGRTRGRIS